MDSASLQAFVQTTTVAWPAQQKEQGKQILLKSATAGHARIMQEQTARAGIPPDFTDYANTPGNTDLNSVKLPGPIVFNYKYIREIVQVARDWLQRNSPVDSGEYVRSHTLFVDGAAVDVLPPNITGPLDIMIANLVPYARKIEVGKTESGRAFVIQVAPNIYERCSEMLISRYGEIAKISFGYSALSNAYALKSNQVTRHFSARGLRIEKRIKQDHRAGSAVTSPTIFIESI